MKLMLKVFIVLASLVAVMFYFLKDEVGLPGKDGNEKAALGNSINASGLQTLANLPSEVQESSGIEVLPSGEYVTHNDAGNKPYLYQVNASGKLTATHQYQLPNVDWEDLARDDDGNIYIADTGNNNNKRKEFAIYKVNTENTEEVEAIRFKYGDQESTSRKKSNFDCEAIFWHDGNIYLVTKDRLGTKQAKVYSLPATQGNHTAKLLGRIKLKHPVTGASISPDGQTIVLLSEERLHVFKDFDSPAKFYEATPEQVNLKGSGQTEAVSFKDDKTLVLTSEGGKLYQLTL